MITIECLVQGRLDNNVYFVSDGEATLVVDPSTRPQHILERLGGRKVDAIMCTHFHSDHTGALAALKQATGATVYASVQDTPLIEAPAKASFSSPILIQEPCKVDACVNDGDVVCLGSMEWSVIHTPGHSKGSMCWYLPAGEEVLLELPSRNLSRGEMGNKGAVPVLLSGDTLFSGCTGRTDFEGGSISDMQRSMSRLAELPDETLVLPGHNSYTSIAMERAITFSRWGVSDPA